MTTESDFPTPFLTPREEGGTTPRGRRKRARALLLVRSRSQHDVRERSNPSSPRSKKRDEEWEEEKEERERQEGAELSNDPRAPGLLKIFGESVVAGAQYKTVLASTRSTAQELIKQALERYGLPARLHREFVLCEVAGRVGSGNRQTDSPRRADRRAKRRGERGGSGLSHLFRSRSKSPGRDKRRKQPHSARPDDSDRTKQRNGILVERARSSSPPFNSPQLPNSPPENSKLRKNPQRSKLVPCIPSAPSRGVLALSTGHCDSPRTPLGSPRTPCGSPSTSRGSPRTSLCNTDLTLEHSQGTPVSPRRSGNFERGGRGSQTLSPRCSGNNVSQGIIHNGQKLQTRFNSVPDVESSFHHSDNGIVNRYEEIRDIKIEGEEQGKETEESEWTEVSVRVLSNKDKPLLLQGFWKPPEGLFRRFELRRRRDIAMSLEGNDSSDDTFGLNANARRIMISKVSPGVIPILSSKVVSLQDDDGTCVSANRRATLKEEWDKASMMTNATLTYGSPRSSSLINAVEGDTRQAYVCPSIYPYLLTLRGCSIQKDLVLYPLKSRSLSIGSSEKKGNSDDICLCADDVLPVHCRVTLKRLPQGEKEEASTPAGEQRLYWYCLDLDIYASAYLTVNGVQVKQRTSIYPGDLVGIGRQYLFLYKDPTGGHDIPSAVPWLPADRDVIDPLYTRVCRDLKDTQLSNANLRQSTEPHVQKSDSPPQANPNPQEFSDVDELNDSALRDAAIFLAYHRDRELEVLEAVAELNCWGRGEFPSCLAVLFLAAHHYSVRKFSGDHQATFFKRLVRVIRARVGEKSPPDRSEPDNFPCLIGWLSNILTLLGHFRSAEFQTHVNSLARRADVTSALQECVNCLEETVNFLFQQAVYTVTKALYNPINNLANAQRVDGAASDQIDQILGILAATQTLSDGLNLHKQVTKQLLAYLLFFLSTTLFNRVIVKGSQLYNRDFGSALQADLTKLENCAGTMGLTSEFSSFSEHLMSLTDLLASSKRSLMRLDWEGFQRQFAPLTDAQLCKILSEYNLGEGTPTPTAWYPHYAVDTKEDLTLSLSAHPEFTIPREETPVSLSETFPPAFFRRLEQVQHKFSLVGEDAYYSGLSSAGNTPRLSESLNKNEKITSTFFLQESMASSQHVKTLLNEASRKARDNLETGATKRSKNAPPVPPPKPTRPLSGEVRPEVLQIHAMDQQSQNGVNEQQQQQPQHQHISSIQQHSSQHDHRHHQNRQETKDGDPPQQHRPWQQPQQQHPQTSILSQNSSHSAKNGSPETTIHKNVQSNGFEKQHPAGPPPYNMAIKNRRRPAEGAPATPQSQPSQQPSMWTNHQNKPTKPLAHAAILKHGTNNGPHEIQTKAPYAQGMHNIQTLPDFLDKSTKRSSAHQQPGSEAEQRHLRPALKSQRSWVNAQRFEAEPFHNDLASSYPLTRPRPSSATEIDHSMVQSQREESLRLRSNSALGNKSRHGHSAHGSNLKVQNGYHSHQHNNAQLGQNYEHVKDSIGATLKQHASNLKRSPRREDLSHGCPSNPLSGKESDLSEHLRRNQSGSRLVRSSRLDLSDPDSVAGDDAPPPLPPKGEFLLSRTSMGSQNSLESSGNGRPRVDSDPHTASGSSSLSARGGSGRTRCGSRTSVEIQDVADHLVYNPNLPVQDMLDHNQNFFKMESKNIASSIARQHSSNGPSSSINATSDGATFNPSAPHIPPLEFPDDLIAASDMDSPVDTFSKLSSRLPSDSTTSSVLSDRRHKFPSATNLNSQTLSGSRSNLAADASHSSISSDKYPDDIYIDVPDCDVDSSGSAASLLKVLPVQRSKGGESDPGTIAVRYRHAMPEPRDIATNGQVTGEVFSVSLKKDGSKLGMGLIDGLHTSLKQAGIYVRNVLPDTPAALCGAIRVGDRILAVNGKSIVGADYQSAMVLIRSTGPRLELLIAKCDRSVASKISASTT
ncbi:hypothetical protein EGW08_002280 [Elysia chlorotica]|uniref:Ras-associating and dilute domain-containing protein n=1 Tax=Elysia chlorotica TaxID=188477 RepID=A0A3S1BJS0_ELYCH|nr:hypothetical protein EGW08_002280 [Elysia chlorotica]